MKYGPFESSVTMEGFYHTVLRYATFILLLICVTSALDFGYGQLLNDQIQDGDDSSELISADKRYARLSYFRQPKSRYRWGYRRSRYSSSRNHWDYLPDRNCFRNRCRSKYDCCKRYSTCDPSAKICYDCWYGHPCSRNSDCCMRFPRCSSGMCTEW